MDFLSGWMTVLVVGFLAVAAPGPDFAMTLRNSLVYSRRAGLLTALGISMGLTVHIGYTMIGAGVLVSSSALLFNVLKWLGAAYLIWVGFSAIRAGKSSPPETGGETVREMSAFSAWRKGFLTNVLNPKAPLFFLALYTQVLDPQTPLFAQAIYGLTLMIEALLWFSLVALLVSHPRVRQGFMAITHWVERLIGVAFIALGLRLALSRAIQ